MRFKDIKPVEEAELFEINMSPSSLEKLASKIDARAGMEFEMIVPDDVGTTDDDIEMEADYDRDERVNSWSDIEEFFLGGDGVNSRRGVQAAIAELQQQFFEYVYEQAEEQFSDDVFKIVFDWIKNRADGDEIKDALNLPEDTDVITREDLTAYTNLCIEEQNSYYEEARDNFFDEARSDADEFDWLTSNYRYMSDIENETGLSWPYYKYNSGENINKIANEFSSAIGKPVTASSSYKGARRESGRYVVEPDGSLNGNNRVIVGADGKKYKIWYNDNDDDNDDNKEKMAAKDKEFLDRWKSRMKKQDPNYVDQEYRVEKYSGDEIGLEFVSPPMPINELFDDLKKLQAWVNKNNVTTNDSTGLHMNVSVPNWQGDLQQLDYVKLALLLGDEYVLNQFGRISNIYTQSALAKVREQVEKRPDAANTLLQQMKQHLEYAATEIIHGATTSKYTSINVKKGYIEFRSPGGDWLNDLQENPGKIKNTLLRFVVALDAAVDPEKYREEYLKKLYKLLGADSQSNNTIKFFADYVGSYGPARQAALKSFIKQVQLEREATTTSGRKMWWNVILGNSSIEVVATTKQEAINQARTEWKLPARQVSDVKFTAKPVRLYDADSEQAKPEVQASSGSAVPGSAAPAQTSAAQPVINEPQTDRSGFGNFTGTWRILDPQGRELHRFSGVGNSQHDANNFAIRWLRSNPRYMQTGVEVVPEMR